MKIQGVLLVLLLLLVLVAAPLPASSMPDPNQIVQQVSERVLGAFDNDAGDFARDPDLVREMVERELLPHFDVVYSARLVLGRHARGVSEEDLKAFADLLVGQLIRRYAEGLEDYPKGTRVEVQPQRGELDPRRTRVSTRLLLPDGRRIPMEYVARLVDEEWRVYDVLVDGVSFVLTFRNQFARELERRSVPEVIARMRSGDFVPDVDAS